MFPCPFATSSRATILSVMVEFRRLIPNQDKAHKGAGNEEFRSGLDKPVMGASTTL